MNLFQTLKRDNLPLSMNDFASMLSYNGLSYQLGLNQTLTGDREEIAGDFEGLVRGAYKRNGIVFACILARQLLFSEARFQFRQIRNGRPGDLFGNQDLALLEQPWVGGTTGDLLSRMEQDASLAGNSFTLRWRGGVKRLRPDWVSIVLGSNDDAADEAKLGDLDAELIGYVYHPGGRYSGQDPVALLPEEVAHYAPIPDPEASYRGMSWLQPVLTEIMADQATSAHKLKFFENGATPNMVVKLNVESTPEFNQWVETFRGKNEGIANAYKTMFLGAGHDVTVVGADLRQLDFKATQGAGETRIAAAARVPPIIVGLSEGLDAATYSNYGQARRAFADATMRPLWRNAAGSLARIVNVPSDSELWYDDRDIAFLQEDQKDGAEILQIKAATVKSLIDAGFEAQSVVAAVTADDMTRLVHTGLFSVQLQPAGTVLPPPNGLKRWSGAELAAILDHTQED